MSRITPSNDASLLTILPTHEHRTELALLVALHTDCMRREITTLFTPSDLENRRPSAADRLADLDAPSRSPSTASQDRQRIQNDRDLSSRRMQGLQRAALMYFDAWQIRVLRRLGEVLNVRSDAILHERRAFKEAELKAKREKENERYWNWAEGHDLDEKSPEDGPADEKNKNYKTQSPVRTIPTKLTALDSNKRLIILNSLLLLLLSLETYSAHSRVLLLSTCASLHLPLSTLPEHEAATAAGLLQTAAQQMSADEQAQKRATTDASARKWKVGLATVAGAALIGVTGGLAAPLLAAGVGSVLGGIGLGATAISGLLGTLAGSSVLIGGLFGAYGGKMTGAMVERYAREVQDFAFLSVSNARQPPPSSSASSSSSHKLRVAIGINGWLTRDASFEDPWRIWDPAAIEPFALRWESAALHEFGTSLTTLLSSFAWSCAKWELVRRTLLGSLYAGLFPLALLRVGRVVDNPFSIARARADKAGRILADALVSRVQGERPVTLVGFSVGARVVYACLLALAEHNAFGIVENVVVMGAAVPASMAEWTRVRAVVSGRVVNAYSENDFVLGFLYRGTSLQAGIAGVQAVDVRGVENVDMTEVVTGHTTWERVIGQVLSKSELGDLDDGMVEGEVQAMKAVEESERREARMQQEKLGQDGKADVVEKESHLFVEDKSALSDAPFSATRQPEAEVSGKLPSSLNVDKQAVMEEKKLESKEEDSESDTASIDGRIQMVDLDPIPEPDD